MSQRPRALITGAAVRLGRAMALDLAASGWDVAIHYNSSSDAAADTVRTLKDLGGAATALQANLENDDAVATLVARSAAALKGPLSLLINNASLFEDDRIATTTPQSWDRAMASNLRAPVHLVRDFAAQAPKPEIDASGEPIAQSVVINMIDQRVLKPTPMFHSYFLAKSALLSFTQTAAMDLAPDIRVAAIGPGPTLPAARQSAEHFRKQRKACMLQRGADPEDIVHAMRFILGNKAFTGQMLAIDGGQHLNWKTPDIIGNTT